MTDIDPIDLEQLQCAYDRLPHRHAAIFSAKCRDKLTYAEIAERTDLARDYVMHIFADALFRLNWDVCEQRRGVTIGPIRRWCRNRKLAFRLHLRVWRNRW